MEGMGSREPHRCVQVFEESTVVFVSKHPHALSEGNSLKLFRIVAFRSWVDVRFDLFFLLASAPEAAPSAEGVACLCLTANVRVSHKYSVLMMV